MKEKSIPKIIAYIDNKFKTRNIYYVDKQKYIDLLTFSNVDSYDIFSLLQEIKIMKRQLKNELNKDEYNSIIKEMNGFDILYKYKLLIKIYFHFVSNEIEINNKKLIYIM